MLITYVGFVQSGSIRSYRFEGRPESGRAGYRTKPVNLAVTADMSIVSRFHVRLQDLPSLCQRTLSAALHEGITNEEVPESMVLTEAHVRAHCDAAIVPVRPEHRKRFHPKPSEHSQLQWPKKV